MKIQDSLSSDLNKCSNQTKRNLDIRDFTLQYANDLYVMYFTNLSQKTRRLFSPYPLFSTPCESISDFELRVKIWLEELDWRIRLLYVSDQLVGLGLLKRIHETPTSGVLVLDKWQASGFGRTIMNDLIQTARDLKLSQIRATIEDTNIASIRLHESLGFKSEENYKMHQVFDGTSYHVISARHYLKSLR